MTILDQLEFLAHQNWVIGFKGAIGSLACYQDVRSGNSPLIGFNTRGGINGCLSDSLYTLQPTRAMKKVT